MALKICVVTSNRADWGLLSPVLALLRDDPAFDLRIVATGQHLIDEDGGTVGEISADGFEVAHRIAMSPAGDTPAAITAALARAIDGFGEVYAKMRADLLLVLGDRYEIFGAVAAAALAQLPVAHIAGGDVTEGAVDEAFRHAITKMSHLHFVTSAAAARRVCQMGENPHHVFVVGSPGLDRIRTTATLERQAFFQAVKLTAGTKNIIVTYHPETLDPATVSHCRELLVALDALGPDVGILFSASNIDVQGRTIRKLIEGFVGAHPNTVLQASLGSVLYFSALCHMDAVVGNSSSGLYEAPSFGTPTVNVGDRQKGRLRAASVIDVGPEHRAIGEAIRRAFATGRVPCENPYGDGHASERIVSQLKVLEDPKRLLKKRFVDWSNA